MLTNTKDVDFILPKLKAGEDIKKIAYTGTHGTGKTTSTFNMATQCKLGCHSKSIHIITEVASESPFKINKETTETSQLWIFTNQIKVELDNSVRYKILISDRTIVDSMGYSLTAGFTDLVNSKFELAKQFIHTYDYIFFKNALDNNFIFEDGIRDGKDLDFRNRVEDNINELFNKLQPYMKKDTLIYI